MLRVFFTSVALVAATPLLGFVDDANYETLVAAIEAACSGDYALCAAEIEAAVAQIIAGRVEGNTLTDAQLAGLTVLVADGTAAIPDAARAEVGAAVLDLATEIEDDVPSATSTVLANAILENAEIGDDVVAELASPS
ncbi:MAG: hypothetical protein AAF330_04570 [Pseudomonadota bacterium]